MQLSIIVTSVAAAVFYCIGILLMTGKGGCLIAGYHFEPKGDKAKKHHKYIMLRYGAVFTIGIGFVHSIIICAFLEQHLAMYILIGICVFFLIASCAYLLCSKKLKQARLLEKEETNKYNSENNL